MPVVNLPRTVRDERRRGSGDPQIDIHVAAHGVGVRAHLVGFLGQLQRLVVLQPGKVHDEARSQFVAAPVVGADPHLGGHLGPGEVGTSPTGHDPQRAVGTGRVTRGEELLRVGGITTRTTHFGGDRQLVVHDAVGGTRVPTASLTGRGGFGRVQHVRGELLRRDLPTDQREPSGGVPGNVVRRRVQRRRQLLQGGSQPDDLVGIQPGRGKHPPGYRAALLAQLTALLGQ